MPLYEYECADCKTKFDALRAMSKADAPIACPACGGEQTRRKISLFAAIGSEGKSITASSSSCGSCSSHSCATCGSRH